MNALAGLPAPAPIMPGAAMPSGRAMLDGSQCQTGERVQAGDLLAVNFDVRDVSPGGGLYLLQSSRPGDAWRGCRYMMRTLSGGITIDDSGRGDWVTVPDMSATGWRVVGAVETVYRPVN